MSVLKHETTPLTESSICTLFEGHYHYGLAALTNSLSANGFTGTIYAGYRGKLPEWAKRGSEEEVGKWKKVTVLQVNDCLRLLFIPLSTNRHFTNYKPTFMLELFQEFDGSIEHLCYFDPDIVVLCNWAFFETWVSNGVALCADVNWHMPDNHPIRNAWKLFYKDFDRDLDVPQQIYLNAGFIGVTQKRIDFIRLWEEMMVETDLDLSAMLYRDRPHCFCTIDQDVMNAATMCYRGLLSTIGADGMDTIAGGGGYIMNHRIGSPKPWNCNYLLGALSGRAIGRSESYFLRFANSPISPYTELKLWTKRFGYKIAKAVNRFYKR